MKLSVISLILIAVQLATTVDATLLASFNTVNDVANTSALDLDVKDIQTIIAAATDDALKNAYNNIYNVGKNANQIGSTTTKQTLKSLSTTDITAAFKLTPIFLAYSTYYKSANYADDFTTSAFLGTGDFVGKDMVMRVESAQKGAAYQQTWINIVNLLHTASTKCASDANGAIKDLENAWARYTGSSEGVDGATAGYFLYSLAEKRCANFGTCSASGRAKINGEILSLFETYRIYLSLGMCTEFSTIINKFASLSAVPRVQAVLRYAYYADANGGYLGASAGRKKEWAEGWAFLHNILPQIDTCDKDVAATLRSNMDITVASPMKSGHVLFRKQLESVYQCLGITCAQVGYVTEITGNSACIDTVTSFKPIAGYTPISDVTQQALLDRDLDELGELVEDAKYTDALALYTTGKYSHKGTGLRSLQSLSTSFKNSDETNELFDLYSKYWGSKTYADDAILAVLNGQGDYQGAIPEVREEIVTKYITYQSVWMKVFEELYEGIENCEKGELDYEDGIVLAWDEAWAYYVGSLANEGTEDDGVFPYSLAEKRCADFSTCINGKTGDSLLNIKIRAEIEEGRSLLRNGDCESAEEVVDDLIALLSTSLIQGTLRYAFRGDPKSGYPSSTNFKKEQAEGWAFVSGVLPQIDKCDKNVAQIMVKNFNIKNAPMADGHVAVRKALESVYQCLGIKCSDVGAFTDIAGNTPCTDSNAVYKPIAGYTPISDVTQQAFIDRDLDEIADLVEDQKYDDALKIYQTGKNSKKGSSLRTLQELSTEFKGKTEEENELFELYSKYWGSATYADDVILTVFRGQGDYQGAIPEVREEVVTKYIAYHSVWMKVVEELYEGIENCEDGELDLDDGGVVAWDEAWAYYVGSLGAQGDEDDGVFPYSLAEKRCADFGTCIKGKTGGAIVNSKIRAEIEEGRSLLKSGNCKEAEEVVDDLIPLLTIPLIQGTLRYAYRADPKAGFTSSTNFKKEQAEGWAFVAAVLPQINKCDKNVAQVMIKNFNIKNSPVADGHVAVRKALESVYPCLNIKCSDIGANTDIAGNTPCANNNLGSTNTSTLTEGAVAGIVIAVLIVYFVSLFCCYRIGMKRGKNVSSASGDGLQHEFKTNGSSHPIQKAEDFDEENNKLAQL